MMPRMFVGKASWIGRLCGFGLLLVIAACSSGARPPSHAAADATQRRELRVGQSGDYPPFSELRGSRFEGLCVALGERYAAALGMQLQPVRFTWASLVRDLNAGRFQLADSGITVRPERSIAARYTVPIARTGAVVLLRRPAWARPLDGGAQPGDGRDPLAQLGELDRPEFRLAVNQGGHLERVARAHFFQAQIFAIPDNAGVRAALAEGRVDALLTNTIEAPRWAQGLGEIETLGPFTRDFVALIVRADQPQLARALDGWLLAQEESGALDALRSRYFGFAAPEQHTAQPLRALLAATAERLALMPAVGAAKRRAGLPIEDRVQESAVLTAALADVERAAADAHRAPLPDAAVRAFFEAQFSAAKQLQLAVGDAVPAPYSLVEQLRPALGRISERMAWLLVRLPAGLERAHVERWVHDDLEGSGITREQREMLVDALLHVSGDASAH